MAATGAVLAAPARRGQVYIALAAVAWSTAGVLQRDLAVDTATQVAGRAIFAGLALLGFVVVVERGGVTRAFRVAGIAGLGFAVALAAASGAFIVALNHTSVANVLFILAIAPVLAALLGRFVLGEPITPRTAVALAVALAGVVLMIGAPGGGDLLGDAMAILASLGFAVGIVISRYRRDVSMAPATFVAQLLLLAAFLPFADLGSVGGDDLVTLVLLGAGQIGVGLAFLTLGARLIPAAQVALISLLEVVLGPLWVWIAIGEAPTGATLVGGAVIVAAVVIQVTGERAGEECEPVADTGGRPLR